MGLGAASEPVARPKGYKNLADLRQVEALCVATWRHPTLQQRTHDIRDKSMARTQLAVTCDCLQELGRWCWQYCQDADARQEAEALWRATSAVHEGVPMQSMMSPQHQVPCKTVSCDG